MKSTTSFSYASPVKVVFGLDKALALQSLISENDLSRGLLISDKFFLGNGLADKIMSAVPSLIAVYSDITPNPLLGEVMSAAKLIKDNDIDFVVALGGGSSMDLAKFASVMATNTGDIRDYFYKRADFENESLPLFALPTTSGTGSEVTSVSVCNDELTGTKAPLANAKFFASYAVVDPMLTLGLPKYQTAVTGLDAFAHAIEAYWSNERNPISDLLAIEAGKSVLSSIKNAYENGNDVDAREQMSYGSLCAGLAFAQTRTAAVHACSYPLSIDYHLSHGEACAFTLDKFILFNGQIEPDRMTYYANAVGFESIRALADFVGELKVAFGLKITLQDIGCTDTEKLAKDCLQHPLFNNNPAKPSIDEMIDLFKN